MIAFLTIALLAATPATDQRRPAPPRVQTADRSATARDKMICKRFTETGSLVNATRVCKTKAEWDRDRDNIRAPSTTGTACGVSETGGC